MSDVQVSPSPSPSRASNRLMPHKQQWSTLIPRTRFPIKSLPILRALGQDLAPVPVPDIIVAPTQKPNEFKKKTATGTGTGTGGSRADAMEID